MKSKPIFPKYFLNFLFNHFYQYPQYYLFCLCNDDYRMINKTELGGMCKEVVVAYSQILYCHSLQGLAENEKSQLEQAV
jgi:hypothetical protein